MMPEGKKGKKGPSSVLEDMADEEERGEVEQPARHHRRRRDVAAAAAAVASAGALSSSSSFRRAESEPPTTSASSVKASVRRHRSHYSRRSPAALQAEAEMNGDESGQRGVSRSQSDRRARRHHHHHHHHRHNRRHEEELPAPILRNNGKRLLTPVGEVIYEEEEQVSLHNGKRTPSIKCGYVERAREEFLQRLRASKCESAQYEKPEQEGIAEHMCVWSFSAHMSSLPTAMACVCVCVAN